MSILPMLIYELFTIFPSVRHSFLSIPPFTYALPYIIFIYLSSVSLEQVLSHFLHRKISDVDSGSRQTWSSIFEWGKPYVEIVL